jgi:hypothetical protein
MATIEPDFPAQQTGTHADFYSAGQMFIAVRIKH